MAPRKIIAACIVTFLAFMAWEVGAPSHLGVRRNSAYGCLGGGLGGGAGGGAGANIGSGLSGSTGVIVDADGFLRRQQFPDKNGQLMRQRIAAARGQLNPQVAKTSQLRLVSLNRLEAAIKKNLANGAGPSE